MPSLIERSLALLVRLGWRRDPRAALSPADAAWAPGDLAQCLLDGPWRDPGGWCGHGPVLGEVRPVDQVIIQPHAHTGEMAAFLVFARYAPSRFEAVAFRRFIPGRHAVPPEPVQPFESQMS